MILVIREIANFCSLKDILNVILVCKEIYKKMKNYKIDLVKLNYWNVNFERIIDHKYFNITGIYMRLFTMDNIAILGRMLSLKSIKLEISLSGLSKTEFLSKFSKLEHLSLIDTTIDNIEGLPPSLTYLDITSSRLENIEPISKLVNLKTLVLNYNYIVSLKPLQNLQNLEVLHLISNNITSLEYIKDLKNIKNLEVEQDNLEIYINF